MFGYYLTKVFEIHSENEDIKITYGYIKIDKIVIVYIEGEAAQIKDNKIKVTNN